MSGRSQSRRVGVCDDRVVYVVVVAVSRAKRSPWTYSVTVTTCLLLSIARHPSDLHAAWKMWSLRFETSVDNATCSHEVL